MTVALVDDAILGQVLRGTPPRDLAGQEVFTTGYWYVRLCQAVLRGDDARGHLSRPFHDHPPAMRGRALDAALALPPSIGLVSLRELGRSMGRLRPGTSLNLLAIEVVAAAQHLEATVHLATASPRLEGALQERDVAVVVHRAA